MLLRDLQYETNPGSWYSRVFEKEDLLFVSGRFKAMEKGFPSAFVASWSWFVALNSISQ